MSGWTVVKEERMTGEMRGPKAQHGGPIGLRECLRADLEANAASVGLRGFLAHLLYHPGFSTVFFHRVAGSLKDAGFSRLAKLLWRRNVARSGCHLHLDASIGPGLALPHATGIVIGSGVTVGRGVTLYQNVTIGRSRGRESYPVVGDQATVYPNAVIVGGVRVGRGAIVGAGAMVIKDVPDHAIVAAAPATILRPEAGGDAH